MGRIAPYKRIVLIMCAFAGVSVSPIAHANFTQILKEGDTHPEVKQLQQFLNIQGFTVAQTGPGSTGQETETFGSATKSAVIRFQETYRDDVLTPAGLTSGNGYFGPYSVAKANALLTIQSLPPETSTTSVQFLSTGVDLTTGASSTRYLTQQDFDYLLKRIETERKQSLRISDDIEYRSPIESLTGVTLGDATFEDTDASFDTLSVSGNTSLATLTVTATTTLDGRIVITSNTAPADTTDTIYNVGGDLYWAGSLLAGSEVGTWASNGTDVYRTTGNIGIGTTNPLAKLDVNGDALINNLTVGRGGGNIGSNTANGSYALRSNTTGNNNTAIGVNALTSNTTGSNNTANGYDALYDNTTGSNNTANGHEALAQNTTGTSNTAIGVNAGYTGTALTTGRNNILIGYGVGATSSNMSYGLNIGNLIYGTGVNGTGNTLSTGNIGIGTTNPSQKLTVVGNVYASSFIDDGITLTAPDYVFDDPNYFHLSLADIEASTIANAHLPWLTPRGSGPMALSERINEILEALENLFLHVFDLAKRLIVVEQDLEQYESRITELEAKLEALGGAGETPQSEPAPDESATPPAIEEDQPEETPPSTAPAQGEEELGAVSDEEEPAPPELTAPPA